MFLYVKHLKINSVFVLISKNVNSFRAIDKAVRYEMCRQATVLLWAEKVVHKYAHAMKDTGTTGSENRC